MRGVALAVLFALAAGAAAAQQAGDLTIVGPWARATAPNAQTGAVYLSVTNKGTVADRLVGASSDVADKADIHESMSDAKGVMSMESMGNGVPIPPGQTVSLKPGAMHVMLMGLKRQLKPGDTIPLFLTFEKAGKVAVTAQVAGPGAMGPPNR